MKTYKLGQDGRTPFKCDLEDMEVRKVARVKVGSADVSTMFLGLDHNHTGKGGPILFETMILGDGDVQFQDRYETWEDAQAGHDRVVLALHEGRTP